MGQHPRAEKETGNIEEGKKREVLRSVPEGYRPQRACLQAFSAILSALRFKGSSEEKLGPKLIMHNFPAKV